MSTINSQNTSINLKLTNAVKSITKHYYHPNEDAAKALFKLQQLSTPDDFFGFQTGYQIIQEFLQHATDYVGTSAYYDKRDLESLLSANEYMLLDTTTITDKEYKQAIINQYQMEL